MAAGRGTRMRSRLPKVLHPLCGRPLLLWTVEAAREAGAERIVVVLGDEADEVARRAAARTSRSRSRIRRPAPATRSCRPATRSAGAEHVIVLSGDHPLLDAGFITALAERHASSGAAATVTTRELEDPGQYGRVVRGARRRASSGSSRPRHPGDATPEELAIKEINAGTYAFAVEPLFEALAERARRQLPGRVLPRRRAAAAARRRARGSSRT